MATINKVDIGVLQTLGASNPRMGQSAASLPAYPLAAPANHEVTTAAKLPVADGARVVAVGCVEGASYAISGVEGDTNIEVGAGWWCPPGQVSWVPVKAGHTHLLVIAAA
jgi:hypothetical protein